MKIPGINLYVGALIICTAVFATSNFACKKQADKKVDPPKTLTKSMLYDKEWYSEKQVLSHKFNSNGTYYNTGTGKWVNNSDTMEIKMNAGGYIYYWHFEWNTEHEFSAHLKGNNSA